MLVRPVAAIQTGLHLLGAAQCFFVLCSTNFELRHCSLHLFYEQLLHTSMRHCYKKQNFPYIEEGHLSYCFNNSITAKLSCFCPWINWFTLYESTQSPSIAINSKPFSSINLFVIADR